MALARRCGGDVGRVFELRQRIFRTHGPSRAIGIVCKADIRRGQEKHFVIDLRAPVGQAVLGFGTEVEHRTLIIDAALGGDRLTQLIGVNLDPIRFERFAATVDVVVSDDTGRLHVGLEADHGAIALLGLLQLGNALNDVVRASTHELFPKGLLTVGFNGFAHPSAFELGLACAKCGIGHDWTS